MSIMSAEPKSFVEVNQANLDSLMKTNLKVRKQLEQMNSLKNKTKSTSKIPTKSEVDAM